MKWHGFSLKDPLILFLPRTPPNSEMNSQFLDYNSSCVNL